MDGTILQLACVKYIFDGQKKTKIKSKKFVSLIYKLQRNLQTSPDYIMKVINWEINTNQV